MSQQEASSQAASRRSPSPPIFHAFSLDEVDVEEQERLYQQLNRKLDSAYERAVEEAIKRSLSTASDTSSQADSTVLDNAEAAAQPPSVLSPDLVTDMDNIYSTQQNSGAGGAAAAASSMPKMRVTPEGSSLTSYHSSGTMVNGIADDADDEDEDMPRSRRGQFDHQQQHRSERRPSLDRLNNHMSERRPSLDRVHSATSERRPSLERVNHYQSDSRPSMDRRVAYPSERRPSLERADNYRSERRPSLDRRDTYQSERRPSLDRSNNYRSERRASLDRAENQQSHDRSYGSQSERRPSLERLERHDLERRPSLDRMQSVEERLQSINCRDDAEGTAQGINTLRPWPLSELGIPTNWDASQLPDINEDGLYCLVKLSPADREYAAITVDFEEAGLKVVSVERLQNTMLLDRFKHEKEQLLKLRPPDFDLNERYLYHGTQANQHCLCEEGLDHRLSFQGCFGRGIYFSDNPRKCMQYANSSSVYGQHNTTTRPMILVCRVLLGESKRYDQGIKDSNLKREPEKPKSKGGWRYYDSVQGIPVDYPEFVVYDNRRSMIEYIVTFDEVSYRAPPSVYNFYTNQIPALYKVEPIVLPIPEEELDKMYMLGPDTDSDGSCDEHTREVERLRDNVKRAKAKRLGIPFRPPTKEEKRYERLHWKRVCYYSCPPGSPLFQMMIMKKEEEKAERKKRKQQAKEQKLKEEGGEEAAAAAPSESDKGAGEGSVDEVGAVGGVGVTDNADIDLATEITVSDDTHTLSTVQVDQEQFDVENDSVAEVLSTLIADFLNITTTDDVPTARRYILDNSMDLDKALCSFYRDI